MDKKVNTTQNIMFYNMGSSFTQAALVRFSNDKDSKDRNHKKMQVNSIKFMFSIGIS